MAATKQDIARWFDEGAQRYVKYMLIICDTYDYDDYPVYANTDSDCLLRYKNPGNMQRVMEVYNLEMDKAEQMSASRVFNLPR